MATVFKTFLKDDIATTRTLLHEAVPVSGGIVDGTSYDEDSASDTNVKNYTHEMFQSVYDYSYTKSSSNHIFDLSAGVNGSSSTDFYDANDANLSKKQIIYNEFAQILSGHDINGNIRAFDADGDFSDSAVEHNEFYVISIARLLNKDEIKKGSFYIKLNIETAAERTSGIRRELLISDEGSGSDYKVNSPAGDYGILKCRTFKHYTGTWASDVFTQSGTAEAYTYDYDTTDEATGVNPKSSADYSNAYDAIKVNAGLIFYQAGVIILSPYVFKTFDASADPNGKIPTGFGGTYTPSVTEPELDADFTGAVTVDDMFKEKNIPRICDGLRKRIHQIAFNNTTELNSTIYFCRVNHNDFNYSSNPTYLDAGKIRVKQETSDAPVSYITSVGLYSANNELLAVAKLSEPLRKDPTNEMVLRVRLDY